MNHDHHVRGGPAPRFWRSRYAIGLLASAAIALFFLLGEHRGHAPGALPYLLLLACPFLHFFVHRGHGHVNTAPTARRGRSAAAERTATPEELP